MLGPNTGVNNLQQVLFLLDLASHLGRQRKQEENPGRPHYRNFDCSRVIRNTSVYGSTRETRSALGADLYASRIELQHERGKNKIKLTQQQPHVVHSLVECLGFLGTHARTQYDSVVVDARHFLI